jgi:hypothetical protein
MGMLGVVAFATGLHVLEHACHGPELPGEEVALFGHRGADLFYLGEGLSLEKVLQLSLLGDLLRSRGLCAVREEAGKLSFSLILFEPSTR